MNFRIFFVHVTFSRLDSEKSLFSFSRFYDITMPDQPMMRLPLFDSSNAMRSLSNFASVTGDLAVDFDIGLPSVDDMGVSTYPIYIIQESGDVWALYCKFSQSRYSFILL